MSTPRSSDKSSRSYKPSIRKRLSSKTRTRFGSNRSYQLIFSIDGELDYDADELLTDYIKVNVTGCSYLILRSDTDAFKGSRLWQLCHMNTREVIKNKLCQGYFPDTKEFYFNRPNNLFEAILALYQTGQLHKPDDVCWQIFENELSYWKVPEQVRITSSCDCKKCQVSALKDVTKRMDEPELDFDMDEDKLNYLPDIDSCRTECCGTAKLSRKYGKLKRDVWVCLEYPQSSKVAMVFSILIFGFIGLSLSIMILDSFSQLPINTSCCNNIFTRDSQTKEIDRIVQQLVDSPSIYQEVSTYYANNSKSKQEAACITHEVLVMSIVHLCSRVQESENILVCCIKIQHLIESRQYGATAKSMFDAFMERNNCEDIVPSALAEEKAQTELDCKLSYYTVCWLDKLCLAWFTLEWLLRMWAAESRVAYFKNILTYVDLIAFLPDYITILLALSGVEFTGNLLSIPKTFRLFRALRIVKLVRYSKGMQLVVLCLKQSMGELTMLTGLLGFSAFFFGAAMYYAEAGIEDTEYTSIPKSMWISIVTYFAFSDFPPSSNFGIFITFFAPIFGILVLAFPVSIIVENFASLVKQRNEQKQLKEQRKRASTAQKGTREIEPDVTEVTV